MRTILDARTSSGYASRSRDGIHSVLDVETALAAADTAARLQDRLAAGERISGPAARRALTAVAEAPRFTGRLVTKNFTRQATAYLAPRRPRPVRQPRQLPDLRLQTRLRAMRPRPRRNSPGSSRLPPRMRQRRPHRPARP